MRVATVQDFRERTSEMLESEDVVIVMSDGRPVGLFVPLTEAMLTDNVRRAAFQELTSQIAHRREELGLSEDEVVSDFVAERARTR
jgi:antitoxin (DNA-binding transcriptional repressor) of toxin-antitoxin stability system